MGDQSKPPRAAQTIRARAAEVIEKQRDKMRKTVGSAIEGRDPEGVHDMRVASRRLRAALAVFRPWLDDGRVREARKALRTVTRALGSVRELDVMRLRLAKLSERARPERRIAIEVVDGRAARRRMRARARMMRRFAAVDLDELDTRLCALTGATPDWAPSEADGEAADGRPDASGEPVIGLLQALAPGVVEAARRIAEFPLPEEPATAESVAALHEVRIQSKKLRYQLEILAPHLRRRGQQLVETLKALQDRLGDYHDDSVLEAALQESVERQKARHRPLLVRELRRLRNTRRAALRRDERACRAALEKLRTEGFAEAVADALVQVGALTPWAPRRDVDAGVGVGAAASAPAATASQREPDSDEAAAEAANGSAPAEPASLVLDSPEGRLDAHAPIAPPPPPELEVEPEGGSESGPEPVRDRRLVAVAGSARVSSGSGRD